jgi:CheY-like chemotaxis protein
MRSQTVAERFILFVDDSPDDRDLALRALRRSGLTSQIVFAHDGAEALEHLFGKKDHGAKDMPLIPQVMVLDLKLPKIGGLEVLQQVRSRQTTRRLPVVILTSSDDACDIACCYELGANSYVRKPVDFTRFASAIEQVLLYWFKLNQSSPTACGVGA